MTDLRVLVLAEDPLARAGLVALLQAEDNIAIAAQTRPDADLLEATPHDVALYDLGWDIDSDELPTAETPAIELDTPLLLFVPDDTHLNTLIRLLTSEPRSASWGILSRGTGSDALVAALHATTHGIITLDPDFVPHVAPSTLLDIDPPLADLTPREREVLDLLAEGLPNKAIARQLTISEYTVKFHVNAILSKLDAGSRTEAVVRATRLGLISL